MRTGIATWVLGAFLAVASLSAASAQEDDDWGARDRVVSGQVAPLDRILPQIRRNHPGTFYDAQGPFQGADGEMHYRLKWMTPEGRVIWFDANARTGRVLGADVGRRDFGGGPNYGGGYDRGPNDRGDYDRGPNDGDGRNYGAGRNNFGGRPDYDGGSFGDGPGGGPGWGGGRGNWPGGGHGDWGGGRGDWGGGRGGWPGGGDHGGGGFGGGRGGGGGHHGHGG